MLPLRAQLSSNYFFNVCADFTLDLYVVNNVSWHQQINCRGATQKNWQLQTFLSGTPPSLAQIQCPYFVPSWILFKVYKLVRPTHATAKQNWKQFYLHANHLSAVIQWSQLNRISVTKLIVTCSRNTWWLGKTSIQRWENRAENFKKIQFVVLELIEPTKSSLNSAIRLW